MPLKPVGCQVIEATESAEEQESVRGRRERGESDRMRAAQRQRDPIKWPDLEGGGGRIQWRGSSTATSQDGDRGSCGGRVPLTAVCSCSLASARQSASASAALLR